MDLVPIFRKVLLGAAESSLDIAGAAVLPPPAWPILKGALQPVLDRIKERLGGEVTGSPERAERAVSEFAGDRYLQEMLRSSLLEKLGTLASGQQAIDANIQKLMLVVSGDRRLVGEILGGVERIEARLDEGVDLSDEAVEKLSQAITRQAEGSQRVRGMAVREMGPAVSALLQDQVGRLQIRAVELLQTGDLDRAVDELRAGLVLVSALLVEAPTDLALRLHLGMVYKAMSQVFEQAGNAGLAAAYIGRAEEIFRVVQDDLARDGSAGVLAPEAAELAANAVHGLGNVKQARGDYAGAIESYRLATSLMPGQFYSWHDMFLCYWELAKRGDLELEPMRHAFERCRETGAGQPGLGAQYVGQLEAILQTYEEGSAGKNASA
jgi:tetratricopeptide (TPR) repeat protein